eukprot:GEMP01018447.1.p1 GENE.GEMP01018447.1~~GEMP01018447.1.p1  ORF type:complete len:628 (+),score=129.10 GEMP01018447.1:268-2151(+)
MQNGVVSATPDAIRGPKKEILPQAMLREKDEVTILGIVDGIGSRVAAWLIFLGVNVRVFDSRAPKETLVNLVENDLRACYDMFETVKSRLRAKKELPEGLQYESPCMYAQGRLLVASNHLEEVLEPSVVTVIDTLVAELTAEVKKPLYESCRQYAPNAFLFISVPFPLDQYDALAMHFGNIFIVLFIPPVFFRRSVIVDAQFPQDVARFLVRLTLFPTYSRDAIRFDDEMVAQENSFKAIGKRPLRHLWAPQCSRCQKDGSKTSLVLNQHCVHVWMCLECTIAANAENSLPPCPTCGSQFTPLTSREVDRFEPREVDPSSPSQRPYDVVVCGAGYLGKKVAAWLLWLGADVQLYDFQNSIFNTSRDVREELENIDTIFFESGKETTHQHLGLEERKLRAMGRFSCSNKLEECVSPSTFIVIEAVIDNLNVKGDIFRRCRDLAPKAILSSNSMVFNPEALSKAAQLKEDEGVFRVRFLDPVFFVPFIETEQQQNSQKDHPQLESLLEFCAWLHGMPFSAQYRVKLYASFTRAIQRIQIDSLLWKRPMRDMYSRSDVCVVCLSRPPSILSIGPCKHICLCRDCGPHFSQIRGGTENLVFPSESRRAEKCPLCRLPLRPVEEYTLIAQRV